MWAWVYSVPVNVEVEYITTVQDASLAAVFVCCFNDMHGTHPTVHNRTVGTQGQNRETFTRVRTRICGKH